MRRATLLLILGSAILAAASLARSAETSPPIQVGADGRLEYQADDDGDRIPDFSRCGYAGFDREPVVGPVRIVVTPSGGDDTARIQTAIDSLSRSPSDPSGVRGSVQLTDGEFRVAGELRIAASGVTLRGAGANRTVVVATGFDRRPLVRVEPVGPSQIVTAPRATAVIGYTPVGATVLRLADNLAVGPGDRVLVIRPSTDAWIDRLGAQAAGVGWRPGRVDLRWERTVTELRGRVLQLDAPITTALDPAYGGGAVHRVLHSNRISEIGIEDLTLRSENPSGDPNEENHAWHGIVGNHAEDMWVRRVRFEGFSGGAVLLREGVLRATVSDCLSLEPISELGGYRRQSFFTQGQQTLFLRCWAEKGVCDFAVGHAAAGPNAFVHCFASETHGDSGPLESWASGVLYDNVRIDGGDLMLGNRWLDPPGAGWSAANCVLWQCQAAQLRCFQPPTAQNWAIGFWAQPVGDGVIVGQSDFVRPTSLFQAQVAHRLGAEAAKRVEPLLLDAEGSTSPTLEEAARFVAGSDVPRPTLRDKIEEHFARGGSLPGAPEAATEEKPEEEDRSSDPVMPPLRVTHGWLTIDGRVLTGGTVSPTWWRGVIRPEEAAEYGPSITRFAPGRYGVGLTDELRIVADWMKESRRAAYDHHYGLWYDRRRDDHLMVRRATGSVAPPFFEQPFARTGAGRAWDGLSKYDLTRYNEWYWARLAEFARLCDERGLVLFHQCFFQHNILEAGAHWADCPWRPANNINGTDLPEPPPYVGDKRIFLAHRFYDPEDQKLRDLQRAYLSHCVDALADSPNVVQFLGDEYTGPLEFTQFWLDTVAARRREVGAEGLLALSTTRDVQEQILGDPKRRDAVDVIDIRYWCYTRDGSLYAPPGGANLAPRQHLRLSRLAAGDFASVARAVREMRQRWPGKAVTFYADRFCQTSAEGWAVLMGGGSLADVPPLPETLLRELAQMAPRSEADADQLELVGEGGRRLVYPLAEHAVVELAPRAGGWTVVWIDPKSGRAEDSLPVEGGQRLATRGRVAWIRPFGSSASR